MAWFLTKQVTLPHKNSATYQKVQYDLLFHIHIKTVFIS